MVDLDFEKWWDCLNKMYDKYFVCNNDDLGLYCFCIVMIVRLNVIEKVCVYMGKIIFIFYEEYLIDVSYIFVDEKEKNIGYVNRIC